ncbi:aminotransferase class V-fold PLP-dependent enzyme [Nonomuraea sediminis]|uniref:aminotransferase class V-fold PLP-dependent enzyme n=1 Tax=Nonomuraea sediminis TaxID=2835864 RepID=UPI001BDDB8C5|nr:aminotransferase class V-fold PLP-dependent enzyme [Nonomuraea sediminis]
MTPEEFREYGKQAVDWIADYLANIEKYPVLSQVSPGDVTRALPETPPERGEPFADVLADLDRIILPGITHWQHPGFFAYFPSNASGPAILGDLLSGGLGVQGMLWATSPACTELETVVVGWLARLLGLPGGFHGVIQDSASSASLIALLAALQRSGRDRARVYLTSETHSSLVKAVRIAGLDAGAVRTVAVDPATLAMDPADLQRLMAEDLAEGLTPAMVCATVGTTSTTAVDPVAAIGRLCRRHGAWLHVDAAYAGVAAVCSEFAWINDGVAEYADSYCTNPHKWLLTNFDCDVLWLADPAPMIEALSIQPEYLRNRASGSGAVIDYRDWQVPLGRRFRALKLWTVIRWYGRQGLQAHIRNHVDLAQRFAAWVAQDPAFEVREAHPFGLVCFRPRQGDPLELMERLNASGALYLTHTKIGDRVWLRMAIGGTYTELRHVRAAWDRIRAGQAAGASGGTSVVHSDDIPYME